MTLVACALLGLEAVGSFSVAFAVLLGGGVIPYLFVTAVGLGGGCALGAVLLGQGGVSVPSRGERGASRGALAGLAVGVVASFFVGANVGVLGTCALAGLAVGRAFDRREGGTGT